MKYRTEWKYICTDYDMDLLRPKIAAVLKLDGNANKEVYNIHSLYFDDYNNACAFDNDAGASERYKWRIRYYDDSTDFIRLEKKEKIGELCYKRDCPISRKQYDAIIEGEIGSVLSSSDDRLLKEFCAEILARHFKPKIIIDYERQAYVEPISHIRITFDRNICGSLDIDRFFERDYLKYPLQEMYQHVLEVKFDDVLPGYLESILRAGRLERNTFSKYYLGRVILERNLL